MITATDYNYLTKERRLEAKSKERRQRNIKSVQGIIFVFAGAMITFNIIFSF